MGEKYLTDSAIFGINPKENSWHVQTSVVQITVKRYLKEYFRCLRLLWKPAQISMISPDDFGDVLIFPVNSRLNCSVTQLILKFTLNTLSPYHQRELTESETSYRPFMSCISVTWVLPWPRPFRRQEAVLSPFILMGEMNVITDYAQYFETLMNKIHNGPIFHKTHVFQTF